MQQKVFRVTSGITPATGTQSNVRIDWPGGRGWLEVTGTFTGATAKLLVDVFGIDGADGAVGTFSKSPHPDFPTGITAPGLYRFESPRGFMSVISTPLDPGDSLTYALKAVVI